LPLLLVLLPAALKLTCCLSNPYNVYKVEHASLFRVSKTTSGIPLFENTCRICTQIMLNLFNNYFCSPVLIFYKQIPVDFLIPIL
jgi:hypothetical protein